MTRREFVLRVAQAGGATASAVTALGLMPSSPPPRPAVQPHLGNGQHVVILGAGMAGMAAAYELQKSGYTCTVLEAQGRPGGRCWTVRRGTTAAETDGPTQTAHFGSRRYMNAGPARIPQHHETTIAYCREFNLALNVFNNDNESAYYYLDGEGALANRPVRAREVETDLKGYAAELLAKAVNQDALDVPLTSEDKERLVDYLRREGGLSPDLFYDGSTRRGYAIPPGAGYQEGEMDDPYDLAALIRTGFGDAYSDAYAFNQQPTMFEPVGGMDRLAHAFADRLDSVITYHARVDGIHKTPSGVRVTYRDRHDEPHDVAGEYCICTIPLSVLKDIPADFSPPMSEAIRAIDYAATGKIGLQFARRFWEEDDHIFGGVTRTNMDITQIWYPCHDYFADKGVLIGYYNFGETAEAMADLDLAAREEQALAQGRKIHPQYEQEFETSFSVAWHKLPFQRGGWATYTEETRTAYYPTLIEPDGPIYLAGDHTSYLTGWMAGAFESAHRVVDALHTRVVSTN